MGDTMLKISMWNFIEALYVYTNQAKYMEAVKALFGESGKEAEEALHHIHKGVLVLLSLRQNVKEAEKPLKEYELRFGRHMAGYRIEPLK
ncbi:hypothetical protein ACFL1B_04005 [Nanoarchaeota archaeon]